MAKLLRKADDGREIWGFDMQSHINPIKTLGGQALGDFEIEIVGSTSIKDRDGDTIKQAGWKLDNYRKNPVVLPVHDYRKPTIARSGVNVMGTNLVFLVEFPSEGINPEADVYRKLYKGGFMFASSVGFIPIRWEDEKDSRGRHYIEQELLELSLCSVPANQEALVTARSAMAKGIITEAEFELISKAGESPLVIALDQRLSVVENLLKAKGNPYELIVLDDSQPDELVVIE